MAFGVKVNGAFLDIDDRSQLTFEINTELWVTGEPSVNLGSYSFPFDIFLTDNNRYLLRFPDRIDAYTPLQKIEGAIVYIGEGKSIGLPVFTGDLYVKSSGRHRASLFMIVEGLGKQKEKKFEDVDMGVHNLSGTSEAAMETLMNGTTTSPLDHDFVFFPVKNETLTIPEGKWWEDDFNVINKRFLNNWTALYATLAPYKGNLPIVPFLRLEIVLERLVEQMGYSLVNDWIGDDDELRKICVFNNKSISDTETKFKYKIRYNEHLPSEMSLIEFLVTVARSNFVGVFVDHYSKVITLRPYKSLLAQNARQNWTDRQVNDYDIEQDNTVPYEIGFDTDTSDAYFSKNFVSVAVLAADGATVVNYWKAYGDPSSHSLIDGYYKVKRDNSVMRYDPSRTLITEKWTRFSHQFLRVLIGGNGKPVLFKAIPVWDYSYIITTSPVTTNVMPRCDIPMTITRKGKFDADAEEDTLVEQKNKLASIRLFIYRGMKNTNGSAYTFPYANATAYDPATESETYNHSLHMDGEKGLYKKRGKEWMEFLRRKKIVTMKLKLTVQDILNHREYDKVRVDNMDYFVKSIRVSVSGAGIGISDVTLVSCPFTAMEDV